MRINRYLASSGIASRRGAETLVLEGRVTVNGVTITELATAVSPGDQVIVDGKKVKPPKHYTYFVLHKPVGTITTAKDPQGRPTVMSLMPATPRVFPVGRLDQDTSGLLLLTDDGDLSHRILHPRYRVEKEYWAVVDGYIKDTTIKQLRKGVRLEDGKTAPAQVDVLERTKTWSKIMLVITEGRNRQVRRMLDAMGYPVRDLHRTRVGPVQLGGMNPGMRRELTREEIKSLRTLVGNPS